MQQHKTYSVEQAIKLIERYCVYQDRCHKEVEKKLYSMNMAVEAKEHILLHLLEHNFLNEERFAKNFARGKFRIKKWGKQRITRELKSKNISKYNINTALKEINHQEYLDTFNYLINKRLKEVEEKNLSKRRKKIANYLLYRGWETNLVYEKIIELIPY